MLELSNPISYLTGEKSKLTQKLKNFGINTIYDLLWHFPFRYEDFSHIYKISEIGPNQSVTIRGKIKSLNVHRSWQRKIYVVEAEIEDDTGSIRAVWFNQPYLRYVLKIGKIANFSGKTAIDDNGEIYLSHPVYEIVDKTTPTKHTARLVPIYSETKGLTSKMLRHLIQLALKKIKPQKEWIPKEILTKYKFPEINKALFKIHFPNTIEEAERARKRFTFEEIFLLQIYNFKQKLSLAEEKAPQMQIDLNWIKEIIKKLPFELTYSQKKSLWEILQDLSKSKPMNRLLQGDVGSGKTVVSALSALVCAKNGYQTAFMAPTEVLAIQHFETFKKLFNYIKIQDQPVLGLLTSSTAKIFYETDLESKISKKELCKNILENKVQIVIGTHALIQKNVIFKNLGLVVIDEQHRFGVAQRSALVKKNTVDSQKDYLIPHFLSMSATPIPRTLMLTIFGDLDISIINELPKNRKPVITKIVPPEYRNKAYEFIRQQIKEGRQAFVICPRIEKTIEDIESGEIRKLTPREISKMEIKNVEEEYEKLSKEIFPEFKVAMLHGKMKPKEKNEIMKNFSEGKIDILVSTSVIEVGVDVPNATIMMIEGAERFGLAQLYQFRGRVGRGVHQSYCFLFSNSNSKETLKRLEAIIKTRNGFELAEIDLKLRGPGEFFGEKQTGFPDIGAKGLMDQEIVKASRESAYWLIKIDPFFQKYPEIKEKLEEFKKKVHLE